MITIEGVTASGVSGSVGTSGTKVMNSNSSRMTLEIISWDVPLHVGFYTTPDGRVPDVIIPASSSWQPPQGVAPKQAVYLAASSGTGTYHVTEYRR